VKPTDRVTRTRVLAALLHPLARQRPQRLAFFLDPLRAPASDHAGHEGTVRLHRLELPRALSISAAASARLKWPWLLSTTPFSCAPGPGLFRVGIIL